MDKISKIIAAALMASGMAYAQPAFAVDTTAEEFIAGLSSDLARGDHATVLAKLNELKLLGFDGILFDDDQMVSIDQLIALITDVQEGDVTGSAAAATLLAYLDASDEVRFINGGIFATTANLSSGGVPGTVFPAGSAG